MKEKAKFRANPTKACPGPDPGLKTLAIRICSKILIWRESFSAKRFHFAGMRAKVLATSQAAWFCRYRR
jgi:hypothetical protein